MLGARPSLCPLRLPTPDALARLVGTLVDRVVRVGRAAKRLEPPNAAYVALYADDAGTDRVACVCDCACVAAVGAALALVPASVAAEAIASGALPPILLANGYEVFNIIAALFNEASGAAHLRLRVLERCDAAASPLGAAARIDLEVAIPAYAPGKLAFITLPI